MKKINEGMIIHNIELDSSITFWTFWVSLYSHMIASIDVMGKETIIAPNVGDFLLKVDTRAIIIADIIVLIKNCI